MSLDRTALARAVARHGAVVRVVIASHKGSSPREAGAAMLVWAEGAGFGQAGTIGGGALEWQAAERARALLEELAESAHKPRSHPPAPRGLRALETGVATPLPALPPTRPARLAGA